jgi:tRNA dimethylallyltransferase
VKLFLAITGATTTGKTALSIEVAEALDGEIVSMDSRQIYRGMDIATDKIRRPLRGRVPHHGLDLRDPDARGWIDEIESRGRLPILVGGTGFFLRALIEPIFAEPELDEVRRARLRTYFDRQEPSTLASWARVLDPERANVAIEGGPQRLGRTLEVPLISGRSLSWWHGTGALDSDPVEGLIVVLELPREELDRRISARVDRMVQEGLVEEVRGLMDAGYDIEDPGMTGTGYREVAGFLAGDCGLDEALETMRSATRRYARRQLTWFRNQMPDDTLRLDGFRPRRELVAEIVSVCRTEISEASEESRS